MESLKFKNHDEASFWKQIYLNILKSGKSIWKGNEPMTLEEAADMAIKLYRKRFDENMDPYRDENHQ